MGFTRQCDQTFYPRVALWTLLAVLVKAARGQFPVVCGPGTFGPNACAGICHCLSGPGVCDSDDGTCSDSLCDYGWTEAPRCQTPCNGTFGPQCVYTCHCSLGDDCSPVNGICSSGSCHPEWYGAGCQTRLPKLIAPPTLANATCGELTVQWRAWLQDFDSGEGPIHSYSLWSRRSPALPWQLTETIVPTGEDTFSLLINNLEPEVQIQFRVDCNLLDDWKRVIGPPGVPSDPVLVSCLTTTKAPTRPPSTSRPPTTTSARPPGPHILDEVIIGDVGQDYILMNWTILANASNQTLEISISHRISGIGDCSTTPIGGLITQSVNQSEGSFLLENLDPWRKYTVTVTATSEHVIDPVSLSIQTGDTGPTGRVDAATIRLESDSPDYLRISWPDLACEDRGGVLSHYDVLVNSSDGSPDPMTLRSNTTSITVDGLRPYSRYSVSVRYVNEISGGKYSDEVNFATAQDVPSSPTIADLSATELTVAVTWLPPDSPNGVILRYGVSHTSGGGVQSTVTLPYPKNTTTLQGLLPYTLYQIKVGAETVAGWGQYSDTREIRTLPSRPGSPTEFQAILRNETCIQLNWSAPAIPNGVITGYQIEYRKILTHSTQVGSDSTINIKVDGTRTHVICALIPATYYQLHIAASTDGGQSSKGEPLYAWTRQDVPPKPPSPVVLAVNETIITIELSPVVLTGGPLTAYQIVVEKIVPKRRRRQILVNRARLPGYVAAELDGKAVIGGMRFVVGDGKTYGGFQNSALEENTIYDVAYVVISELEGDYRTSYSQITEVVRTKSSVPPVNKESDNTLLIVIIIVVLALIILIVVLLLLYWYYKKKAGKYSAFSVYEKDTDKVSLSIQKDDDDLLKYWSKIHALSQKRHVVAGVNYLPDQKQKRLHEANETVSGKNKAEKKPYISLHKEFYSLPRKKKSCSAATKRRNERRNRFEHLLAFDCSRVVLKPDENSDSDYINANFIDGLRKRNAYIAAMSPFNEETVLDFWRMIYQFRLPVVVMITKIEEEQFIKCTQYWPDHQDVATFANFILRLEEVQEYPNYVVRVISVQGRVVKDVHRVTIFDYVSWPEHGVPADPIPLLELREDVRSILPEHSTLLVHCGTGVGRTGAFIGIDALLEQYRTENDVNVYQFVKRMRENRISMVRTIRQYALIYDALFEAVVAGDVTVGEDLKQRYRYLIQRNPKTTHTYLKDQFLSLQEFTPKVPKDQCKTAMSKINYAKNRYPDLLPPDKYRPVINTLGGIERTNYINAIFLDSHRKKNNFILTQTPLPFTVIDFWKLIYDYKVTTVVMMEKQKMDGGHAQYWPDDVGPEVEVHPYVVESLNSQVEGDDGHIIVRSFKLHNLQKPKEKAREIRQFQLRSWTGPSFIPASKTVFLDLVDLVDDWQTFSCASNSPIIVHCNDGATQSGLYCAVSIICQKVLDEGNVDVYHTIKHLKRRRTQIVDQLEQYRFCYKLLWDFISLRMTEKTNSQGSVTLGDMFYGAPSVNLSLYSGVNELDDGLEYGSRDHLTYTIPPDYRAIYN